MPCVLHLVLHAQPRKYKPLKLSCSLQPRKFKPSKLNTLTVCSAKIQLFVLVVPSNQGLLVLGNEQNDVNEVNEGISGDQKSGSSEDFITQGHAASIHLPPLQRSSALGLKEKYKLTQVNPVILFSF